MSEPRTFRPAISGNKLPRWEARTFHQVNHSFCERGASITAIVTIGIDLAKKVLPFRLCMPQIKLLGRIASRPPCLLGMEPCSGARHKANRAHASPSDADNAPGRLLPLGTIAAFVPQVPSWPGGQHGPPPIPDSRLQAIPRQFPHNSQNIHPFIALLGGEPPCEG